MSTTLASPTGHEASTPTCKLRALKIKQAAVTYSVSEITLRRAIQRGLLKPCRAFRHIVISVDQLEKLFGGAE